LLLSGAAAACLPPIYLRGLQNKTKPKGKTKLIRRFPFSFFSSISLASKRSEVKIRRLDSLMNGRIFISFGKCGRRRRTAAAAAAFVLLIIIRPTSAAEREQR
jgi:hypothetical protein